jgi:hypothetical protein
MELIFSLPIVVVLSHDNITEEKFWITNMEAAYESIHRRYSSVGKNRRKKVTFGHIDVYEHVIEMGDNSFVSDGAPITIGWELQNKRAFDISYFETYFPSEERRKDQSLKLSVAQRAKM